MGTDVVPLSHFALLWHACMPQILYWHATDIYMHRYTNTCTHICRDTSTYRYRHMHTDIQKHIFRHTQTHMHIFYIHKHTYIYVRSIPPAHFILSCHLPILAQVPMDLFYSYIQSNCDRREDTLDNARNCQTVIAVLCRALCQWRIEDFPEGRAPTFDVATLRFKKSVKTKESGPFGGIHPLCVFVKK